MKARKLALLLPAVIGLSLLSTGCETTGDPRQGGLFGWSESKAQGRIREREEYLDAVESDTDYQYRRGRRLDAAAAERERELDSYR